MAAKFFKHEYAGFLYAMRVVDGVAVQATPGLDQHRAAHKAKHIRAAIERYNQEISNAT